MADESQYWGNITASSMNQVASGINELANTIGASAAQDKTIEAQKEMQQSQNEWNYQMWMENNQYNSPSMQKQLFEEAGLNPAMFITGLDATSGSPATSSVMSAPSYPGSYNIDFNKINSNYLQSRALDLQEKQIGLNEQKTTAEIQKMAEETTQIHFDNNIREMLNEKTLESIEQSIKESSGRLALMETQKAYTKAQEAYTRGLLKTEDLLRDEKLRNLIMDTFEKYTGARCNEQTYKMLVEQTLALNFDNQEKQANLDIEGLTLQFKRLENLGLTVDILKRNIERKEMESEEWKHTFRRGGFSESEEVQGYINSASQSITSITNACLLLYGMKGMKGAPTMVKGFK